MGQNLPAKPDLQVAQDEILMEVGDVSPSGVTCHQTKAQLLGDHSGEPKEQSDPSWSKGKALRQSLWDRDGRPVLALPGPLVISTSAPAGTKSRPPPSASLGKSEDEVVAGPADTPLPRCMGATPPPSSRSSAPIQAPKVSEDPFLLVPGKSQDYPVEIIFSRETSPAGSTASTWVNLDSNSSRQERSGNNGSVSKPAEMQAKIKQLREQ